MRNLLFYSNHKAGTSWFYKVLLSFSNINSFDYLTNSIGSKTWGIPELENDSVIFLRNADYDLVSKTYQTGVRIIRNPLSVVVSAYFSHLNTYTTKGKTSSRDWIALEKQRKVLKAVSKEEGIALTLSFIERSEFYIYKTAGPLNSLSRWKDEDDRFKTFRHEDITQDPAQFIVDAAAFQGVDISDCKNVNNDDFTFKAMTGRNPGETDNNHHYRNGKADDWKNHIPLPVYKYICAHYSDIIEKYYPESLGWNGEMRTAGSKLFSMKTLLRILPSSL